MLLEVGRVGRPHGVRGEVVVNLTSERLERLAPGAVLETDDGPLVVSSSRPHQDRHLVWFEGIGDRSAAEAIRGRVLRAEAVDDDDELWVHQLIGSEVVDVDGTQRGVVTAVQANPASDLLVLSTGSLVPVRFITSHTPGSRVVVDGPEGLFDV